MGFKEDAQAFARYRDNFLDVENGTISEQARRDYEDRLLDNFVGRTGLALSVRCFKPKDYTPEQERREKTRIVCVSSEVIVGEGGELQPRTFRDGCQLVELKDQSCADRWAEKREHELTEALGLNPQIVCFGELAYPPPPAVADGGWDIDAIRGYGARRIDFEEQVRRNLRKKRSGAFVFLGTYHCLMTLYNVGVVFPWGPSTDGVDVRVSDEWLGEEGQDETIRQEPPITLRKRFPARRAGEVTRTPPQPTFDVFYTPVGRIGVLICSDVIDLNQFLTVVRWNTPTDKYANIDYILVPSFNLSLKLLSMCRELSYIAATTVVVTNANPSKGEFPDTELFCCGLRASDMGKLPNLNGLVTVSSSKVAYTGASLFVFDIDAHRTRQFRDSMQRGFARRRYDDGTVRQSANIQQLPIGAPPGEDASAE